MELKSDKKSDKKSDSKFSFINVKKIFCESYIIWFTIMVVIISSGYILNGNFWHILIPGVIFILLLLISGGEILEEGIKLVKLAVVIIVIGIPVAWYNTPIETKTDSMDITSYVQKVEKDSDCNCDKYTLVDFDKPFEKNVKVRFSEKKYADLFLDSEEFKKFKLTAVKTCSKYISGKVECDLKLSVTHQFEETELSSVDLKNSVYPKKFDL